MSADALHISAQSGELEISPAVAGWTYSGLRILELAAGEARTVDTGVQEVIVLPLSGACRVSCDEAMYELQGRADVFSRVTDFAYVPRDASVTITSRAGGRFALPSAVCGRRLPFRYGAAADVPVETRGAGLCSRQVNNFAAAGVFECDTMIAVEVLTPAGNWSSYPPHKHDEDRPGTESELEEIYYFEIGAGPDGPGMGYQRVYGTPDRPEDLLAEVHTGDVVTIPQGWHGPSMAVPGYDMYYLNVMAGPGEERAWLICDDPSHAWVRDTWRQQQVDPRLPMTSVEGAGGMGS
ncbi:MAG: 5-deoxy-glucuronate isomerase [Nocardioidaceae bacterium]